MSRRRLPAANPALLMGDEPLAIPVRKRATPRKTPPPQEAAVQRAIIDRLRFCGVLAVHVPNEGKRSVMAGLRLKGEGLRPGWPDLLCYSSDGKHALLEVKRPGWRPSDVSENQRACHAELRRRGHLVAVVASQDEAVAVLRGAGWVL